MADIIFPDGTTLASLAPNDANVLASLTPTFSGWSVNPGTNVDMTNELSGVHGLTTEGKILAGTTATIIYDLGSSKRISIWGASHTFNPGNYQGFSASDDGIAYKINVRMAPGYGNYTYLNGIVKCRYIEFKFEAHGTVTSTIDELILRIYQL